MGWQLQGELWGPGDLAALQKVGWWMWLGPCLPVSSPALTGDVMASIHG